MPLRDHFRSPVKNRHSWSAVHGQWPAMMVLELFAVLPPNFRAAPNVQVGAGLEVDVAGFDDSNPWDTSHSDNGDGGVALLTEVAPTLSVEADLAELDEYEVRVYDDDRDGELVAVLELISPSNKDRPGAIDQLVGKAAALLRQGVSVSLVDLVTTRRANLYAELLQRLGRDDPRLGSEPPPLYAVTLRTRPREPRPKHRPGQWLDAWFYPMQLGEPLPTIPIWLSPTQSVLLALESSYEATCRALRIA